MTWRRIAGFALAACSIWGGRGARAPKLVWGGAEVTLLGGPSRDGRYFSYVDVTTRNLALREIATGRHVVLTRAPEGSGEFAYFSAIAPDSRRVAYAWFNDEGFYDLRVIDVDGTHMRVLYRNAETGFVQPCAWSPDSKFVLTLFFRSDNISQLALVPAGGGAPKILRSLNWVYPKRMDMSPDGRFIVYDSFASESATDRTIFLLNADGTRERKLVSAPGNHLFPLWRHDGNGIVYASDGSGTMDAWELMLEEGEPKGEPRLLARDLGRFLPLGVATGELLYYGLRSGSVDVFVTTLDDPAGAARRVTERFPGRNRAPAWSADGGALAYLSRRGSENFGAESRAIVVRRLDSGQERELAPRLAYMEALRWSPDGRTLLVSGSDNRGRGGLYLVDATAGTMKPLVTEAAAPFRGFEGVWSAGGERIYYIHGDSEVRRRELAAGRESVIYRGKQLRHLARSPDGTRLAVGLGDSAIGIIALESGEVRVLPFEQLSELEWGPALIAGRGAELWRVPLDGKAPVKLKAPGNREPGFSFEPNGKRIALTAGSSKSELWTLPLE